MVTDHSRDAEGEPRKHWWTPRDQHLKELLWSLFGVGLLGALLAFGLPIARAGAFREVGGALLSGAVIGAVIVFYQEIAEERREEAATERELEHVRRSDELQHLASIDRVVFDELMPMVADTLTELTMHILSMEGPRMGGTVDPELFDRYALMARSATNLTTFRLSHTVRRASSSADLSSKLNELNSALRTPRRDQSYEEFQESLLAVSSALGNLLGATQIARSAARGKTLA